MAIVVKWRRDGEYFAGKELGDNCGHWTKHQKRAMRFASQREFLLYEKKVFNLSNGEEWGENMIRFVRLTPKKRNDAQDKLLEIAGLYNQWANGRRVSATKTLGAIGEALGKPF